MAMHVESHLIGVDVAKDELVVAQSGINDCITVVNQKQAIAAFLKSLSGPLAIAVEATSVYHVEFVEQAYRKGHTVYLIDGFRLKRYRESIGGRAKTDASDARLLLRYLAHEQEDLRPWSPPPEGYQQIQGLLRRRSVLIQAETTVRQSLRGMPELRTTTAALLRKMHQVDQLIQKRLRAAVLRLGWHADVQRCAAIEGIGPISSIALATLFRRGAFKSADAYIAFMGLDVRIRDSGKSRGRRKLTKKGDTEIRRLLYMAAMTASRSLRWKGYYERALSRGLSRIQALVALARKLARIAFALLKNQSTYESKIPMEHCAST
jgi:transposase